MRALAKPQSPRQPDDVIRYLKNSRLIADARGKMLIDAAIAEANPYKHLRRGSDFKDAWNDRFDGQWDAALAAFDAFLEAEHERREANRQTE